jgi:hypothetical protein
MKDNLLIKRYKVEMDNGTKNMNIIKSYFGSTLMDIEDEIFINNLSISYSDYNNYQYYDNNFNTNETEKIVSLTELKRDNHTINIINQDEINLTNNTKWEIDINIKKILKEYLFARIKESRTFKTIRDNNTKDNDINQSIYNYIIFNILNRYEFTVIDFYIKYQNLNNNIFNKTNKQYNPIFDDNSYNNDYFIKDYNIIKKDQFENLSPIKIIYSQSKSSKDYRFDYYFNITYTKI